LRVFVLNRPAAAAPEGPPFARAWSRRVALAVNTLLIGLALYRNIMLANEHPDFGALSPISIGASPVSLHLYVDNVDGVIERAAAAGAVGLRAVKNEFYGDRTGMIVDPFGHRWHLATALVDAQRQ
jgi:uncharacterized glyoxalase superfamily protein PhnB